MLTLPMTNSGAPRETCFVNVYRNGALELERCAVGVLPLRGMETGCSRADVEAGSSGGALQTCRQKYIRFRSAADLEACCRCRAVEEFASRAVEMRCMRRDVKVWSAGALAYSVLLLLMKFLAFVPQGTPARLSG